MKSLARMYVWWPGLDRDIQQCCHCQEPQSAPPVAPLQPWKWPSRRLTRLHMDFAGHFQGKMILIVVDSHTKWIEAYPSESAMSSKVIELSRTLFARFGLPEVIVTDNGSCKEFDYLRTLITPPLAECAVQLVKKGLKKEKGESMTSRIARVIMAYRTTPQTTTGMTPSELLQGCHIRTRLDLLKPNVNERVEYRQFQQKLPYDSSARKRIFEKGDTVFARNFGTGSRWLSSVVQEVTGPVSFLLKLQDGRVVRRHQDHLRHRRSSNEVVKPAEEPQGTPAQEESLTDSEPDIPVVDPPSLPGNASPANGDPQESATATGHGQSAW